MTKLFNKVLIAASLLAAGAGGTASANEVVRLGNLKFAHFGAVSYIKEIAPNCGMRDMVSRKLPVQR